MKDLGGSKKRFFATLRMTDNGLLIAFWYKGTGNFAAAQPRRMADDFAGRRVISLDRPQIGVNIYNSLACQTEGRATSPGQLSDGDANSRADFFCLTAGSLLFERVIRSTLCRRFFSNEGNWQGKMV